MAEDLLDTVRGQLANFAVGLVRRVEGAGSKVIGSGVLVSFEGRRGILTCGHVAEQYDKDREIGLMRLVPGTQQRRIVDITDAHRIIVQSNDEWTQRDIDLAFTYLNPEVADSIAAQCVFLNVEKNRARIEGEGNELERCHSIDVMFGLMAEYSKEPTIEGNRFVSPMQAVICRGRMHSDDNALLQFQTIDNAPEKLPRHFGGLSGSGLWRIHFADHGAGKFTIIEKRLWGIASWQVNTQNNTGAVTGQGWDRIDQALIPSIRVNLQF